MGLAESLAGKVAKRKGDEEDSEPVEVDEETKTGDIGKRILAAIKNNDAEALEEAIRDC